MWRGRSGAWGIVGLVAALLAAACGDEGGPGTEPGEPVAAVVVTPDEREMVVGDTLSLAATPRDRNGVALTGRAVAWSSDDEGVASVSATGRVAALRAGTVTIRATSEERSGQARVTVQAPHPVPLVAALLPAAATVGGPNFVLTITGSGFAPGARVRWRGTTRLPTVVSDSVLRVEILSVDIADVGPVDVTVLNLPPGGGVSNPMRFTVEPAPQPNPAPAVSVLSPRWTFAGGEGFQLTVSGSGFVAGSVVRWNGAERPTTFVSDRELRALISAGDVAGVGTARVSVFSPAPGGGLAQAPAFAISVLPPEPSPDRLRALYQEDAARIAARQIGAEGQVTLPEARVSALHEALLRVSELRHPARDSVVRYFGVRTFGTPSVRELEVGVDPAAPWAAQWKQGSRMTGNFQVDALMEQYGIQLVRYLGAIDLALLRTSAPLNIPALAARFRAIEGVRGASAVIQVGGGDDIRITEEGGGWRLDYSLGWGDCLSGCGNQHIWSFRVSAERQATYLGSSGLPVPPPDQR